MGVDFYRRAPAAAWPPGGGGPKGQCGARRGGGRHSSAKAFSACPEGEGGRPRTFSGRNILWESRQLPPVTHPLRRLPSPLLFCTQLCVKDVHSSKLIITCPKWLI